MKHLLLTLLLAVLVPWAAMAQSLDQYTFATGQDQNQWITLSSNATQIVAASQDDAASSLTDIGFSFPFGGETYSKFWANSNGVFSFNSTPATSYQNQFNSSNYTANQPKICGISRDMNTGTGGYVKYELTGTAPNRIMVCEFYVYGGGYDANPANTNWQVQLHESGSKVVIIYGEAPSSDAPSSYQAGLSASRNDIMFINTTNHTVSHLTTYSSITYVNWPGAYRYYEFAAPTDPFINLSPASATVVTGFTTTLTASTMNVTGTPNITYSTSNASVATVSGSGTTATVTAVAEGTATITATLTYGNTQSTATCDITVLDACQATFGSGTDYYIKDFTVSWSGETLFRNTSTGTSGTTTNYYSTKSITADPGDELSCTITMSRETTNYGFALWVDFNGDGLEPGDDDLMFTSQGYHSSPYTGTFTIPANTPAGEYRLRVIGTYASYSFYDPCGDYNQGEAEDYKLIVTSGSCSKPTGLTMSNLTAQGVSFSWDYEQGDEFDYSLLNGYVTDPEMVNWNFPTWHAGEDFPGWDNLQSYTDYSFWLRKKCGDNSFSVPVCVFFHTPQIPVEMPFFDDFESGNEWILLNGDLTNQWVWGTATHNGEGTHSLYISDDGGISNHFNVNAPGIVYAIKNVSFDAARYIFSYDYKNWYQVGDVLRVGLVPESFTLTPESHITNNDLLNTNGPEGWILVDDGPLHTGSSGWSSKTKFIDIPVAGNYYVVLAWRNNESGGNQPPGAIDNFSIIPDPCPYDAENLQLGAVTQNSATLYWTGNAEVWEIAYSTYPNTNINHVYAGGAPNATDFAIELTGLDYGTKYEVKVRAWCDENHQGEWSPTLEFTTGCPEYGNLPYTENFDSENYSTGYNSLPQCWSYINTSSYSTDQLYPQIRGASSYSHSTYKYLALISSYKASYTSTDPKPQYAILPAFPNVSDLQMTLWARAEETESNYDATFKVGVMTDPTDANTFTLVATFTPTTTTYQQYTIPFSSYTGNGTYIAIKIEAADAIGQTFYRSVCIDDVRVVSFVPVNLTVSNITSTTANVTWSAGGDESIWQVAYKRTSDADWTVIGNWIDQPQYSLSELSTTTEYQVKVRARIDDEFYDWTDPVSFTTEPPCDIVNNFTMVEGSETDQGATFTWNDNGGDFTVMVGPMHFTSHFYCFFEDDEIPNVFTHTSEYGFVKVVVDDKNCAKSSNGGHHSTTAEMILQITLPIEASLGFNAKVSSEPTYDKAYFSIDGVVQDNLNGISGAGQWGHSDYTLSAGTHTLRWYYVKDQSVNNNDDCFYVSDITIGSYVVDNWTSFEHATSPFTVTGLNTNTEYYAKAIRNCNGGEQSDDSYVAWFKTLSCQPPTGFELVVSPISFICRWDAQIGDVFQYCVLPEGYPFQESYYSTYELLNEPINGKYETAQSVNSDTDYVFYIRKKCGENDFSETVGLSFHTQLAPITVDEGHPFTDDFEGNLEWNLASESINNHWMQGSDENLDCNGNALFIANADNYGYHDDASTVYAFRTFYLTPGTYTYRYDWRANGDENYDYLRVVLAQSLNDITATTLSQYFYEAMPWDQWTPIDGGSQLILSNEWSTKAGVVEITNADYYQVAFIWRNNGDTNKPYPAAIDNFSLSKAQVVASQWDDDFEGSSCGWTLINGDQTNQWAWGTAPDNGENQTLYISNDGGESNNYTVNSPSIVYALKPLVFEEDGYYSFAYTWKNHGEGLTNTGAPTPFDFLRVVLAPSMAALTPGELPTGMNAYNLPEGWIALDEGHCLSGQDDWIRYYEETYLEAGVYTMVLVWRNDGSGGRNPAVVDDVSIASVSCPKPTGLVVENLTSEVVAFHFDVESGAEYQYCFLEDGATLYESMFNSNTCIAPTYIGYGLLGFHPDTDYEICVRKKCGENEFSQIATVTFHTLHECASLPTGWLPLTESFEDMPSASGNNLPSENNLTDCWDYINTSTGSFNVFPLVSNNSNLAYQGDNFLYFLSAYGNDFDPQDQYAILPPMEDIKQLKLSFYAANILNAPTLSVGVMEGMDASTFTAIQTYTTLSTAYALYTVSFENYTGNGNRIAIKMDAANADNAYPVVCIDDVTVSQNYVVVNAFNDFTDDFEYKLKWELVNGNLTNAWAWGEAAHNSYGGRGLYISNDGGTHNAYDKESSTMVYAYKNFMLQAGIYEFSYDWRAYGESKYDYLRVALVPADVDLEANTALPTGLGYLSLPQGWIALDGGTKLNLFIEWQTENHEVEVTESGMYKMVFAWRNDNGAGNNPPAAIDNVSVQLMTCPTPANLAVSNLTSFSADINWTTYPNVDSYTAKFRTARHLDTILTEGFESTIGDWTLRDCVDNTGIVAAGHSGSHSFRFQNSINSPQHLISPELTGTVEGMLLEFYYKNESLVYSETFQVGFSSTDNATDSFTFGDEITAYDTQWHLYSQPIPAGTKYICWKYTSNNRLRLYIDDIALGSEITAGEWVYVNNIESGSYTLSNLAPESTYEVQVKSDCSDKWSDAVSFTTAEIQTMEQTLALAAGWNWWAPMAQINADQLRTALGDNLPQLKSKDGEVYTYAYLIPGQMYKLKTNTAVENVTLEGVIVPINISIEEGANWIGYTGTTASIATALGNNFTPANGDKIISQDGGFAIFNGTSWQGTLTELTHGQGYVYFSKDTTTKPLSF